MNNTIDPVQATRLLAHLHPNTWVEAEPNGVSDAGDVGGDVQAGDAHSRRFVQWLPEHELWAVLTDMFYLAKCDHDEDQHETDSDGEPRCKYCGALTWVENQTELLICGDLSDPGGTEVKRETTYRRDVAALASQETDEHARACAAACRAEFYGDPRYLAPAPTLAQFIKHNELTATSKPRKPTATERGDYPGGTHWTVTIRRNDETMPVPFSMGSAHTGLPDLASVLDCLASDAAGFTNANGFDEWAREYGYDLESPRDRRKAERTYHTIEKQMQELERLLGYDAYEQLLWNTERC